MPRSKPDFEHLSDKLAKLPARPGCYIYRGEDGGVLYVGKAVNLKNRVRSYFQPSTRHGLRIARLVSKVRDIEIMVVDTELEALVLECNLIKEHRPPYNVRLRDDKSYPYITITNERYPRVLFTRKVRKDGSRYFGPYTSAFNVRDTLQLLHKVFPLIPCGKSWSGREEQKPCLYYHLGRCLAPCAGLSDREEYEEVISKVERFLQGREDSIIEDLKREMATASESLDFEKAAKIRDQVRALQSVLEKQKVLTDDRTDQDVIAVVKDERGAAIQMLYIRNGKLIGQRQFILDGAAEVPAGEAVQEFVKQYYANAPEVPREVLLPVEIEERNIVQTWLRQQRGAAVTVDVPQGGEKLRLVEMAANNAEHALQSFSLEIAQKEAWAEEAMSQLQEEIGLPGPPIRVEGYDISNIQGTAPVGSMVVTENGEPAKGEYRRFKIRYHPESPNDFAMMHEVITRRLRAYLDGDEKFAKLPDLIMIDGGKGQLAAALKARDDLGLTVPMVGLAKRMELLYVPIPPLVAGLELGPDSELAGTDHPQEVASSGLGLGSELSGSAPAPLPPSLQGRGVESSAQGREVESGAKGQVVPESAPPENSNHPSQQATSSTPPPSEGEGQGRGGRLGNSDRVVTPSQLDFAHNSELSGSAPAPLPPSLQGRGVENSPQGQVVPESAPPENSNHPSQQATSSTPPPSLQGRGVESSAQRKGPRRLDASYRYEGVSETYTYREIELPLTSPGLMLLRKLRDEAHRFALTFHRKLRDKSISGSALEEIPGVGPRRRRLLLRTFGSLDGIRRASIEEIAAVPTMTKRLAEQVREYLQEA